MVELRTQLLPQKRSCKGDILPMRDAAIVGAVGLGVAAVLSWRLHKTHKLLVHQREIRQAERTGRIRAEKTIRELRLENPAKPKQAPSDVEVTELRVIGRVSQACFHDLNGTPWQPHACPSSRCVVQFDKRVVPQAALEGLDQFSHVWVVFLFDRNTGSTHSSKGKVRLPRAGTSVGVLASRTPHRPNPVGLSLCRLRRVDMSRISIELQEVDLVLNTGIIDVKPFIPQYDARADCKLSPWVHASLEHTRLSVTIPPSITPDSMRQFPLRVYRDDPASLVGLVAEVLAHDIRRAGKRAGERQAEDHSVVLDGVRFVFRVVNSGTAEEVVVQRAEAVKGDETA